MRYLFGPKVFGWEASGFNGIFGCCNASFHMSKDRITFASMKRFDIFFKSVD